MLLTFCDFPYSMTSSRPECLLILDRSYCLSGVDVFCFPTYRSVIPLAELTLPIRVSVYFQDVAPLSDSPLHSRAKTHGNIVDWHPPHTDPTKCPNPAILDYLQHT